MAGVRNQKAGACAPRLEKVLNPMISPAQRWSVNHTERVRVGILAAVPANRSGMAPAVAGLAFLVALTGVIAGAYFGGMPQRVALPQPAEDPRFAAATASEADGVNRAPRDLAVLIEAHEAALAALAWRRPDAICN